MLRQHEQEYVKLVKKVITEGKLRATRNHPTYSIFGESIKFKVEENILPCMLGREIFYKGILGEWAAIIRGPKHLTDFTKWGCNYWSQWAKPDGSINVDYGNAWLEHGQIEKLKSCLLHNPTDRRMIVTGWNPANLAELDLPCCHHTYQFYVQDNELSMTWAQRSVDVMVGLPSDIILAWLMLVTISREFGLTPGYIKMDFGDTHIYQDHKEETLEYVSNTDKVADLVYPTAEWNSTPGTDFLVFEPTHLTITGYKPLTKLGFKVHA